MTCFKTHLWDCFQVAYNYQQSQTQAMVNVFLLQNEQAQSVQNQIYYFPVLFPYLQNSTFSSFFPIILKQNTHSNDFSLQNSGESQKPTKISHQEPKPKGKKGKKPRKEKDWVYQPNEESPERKGKKYKKDENRNIIPNTFNQVFSFLDKKEKSESKLKRVLSLYNLQNVCSPKKYYTYQKLLRSRLNNYLTQAAAAQLFELVDPEFQIYSHEEQIAFIKINGILLSNYLRSAENICRILCSCKATSSKKPAYLSANRQVEEMINDYILESKDKLSFEVLE